MTSFATMDIRPGTLDALTRSGITVPTEIQEQALPHLLKSGDVVVEAPTGSGKTLAFLIPLVERLAGRNQRTPRALIVCPTRELATQIAAVLAGLESGLRHVVVVGGVGYGGQTAALRRGVDVVIGCPGRLLDLAGQRELRLETVEYLVLDEADEMLDAGFARDVERIIGLTPAAVGDNPRQTVLASATMPDWVQRMIDRHLRKPTRIRVAASESESTLEHGILAVRHEDKVSTLIRLLAMQKSPTIVFHRTKHGAKKLARDLIRLGYPSAELQGNLSQNARDRALASFRSGDATVLVATNVAARGIDVANVGLVVNFELPETPQWLTHRVGRTARNGASGRALTFISENDSDQWRKLRRLGAPALPAVDGDALLASGAWQYLAAVPVGAEASGPRPAFRGVRRDGGGGGGGARSFGGNRGGRRRA